MKKSQRLNEDWQKMGWLHTQRSQRSCSKPANKPSTSCVSLLLPKLSTHMEQLVNSYSNLVDNIRFVARLFQQVRHSHEITTLCVVRWRSHQNKCLSYLRSSVRFSLQTRVGIIRLAAKLFQQV